MVLLFSVLNPWLMASNGLIVFEVRVLQMALAVICVRRGVNFILWLLGFWQIDL
jgi:hypothetical protein